jgi:hypothetical protein
LWNLYPFYGISFNLIGTLGYISFAAGGHAGSCRGRSQLFGHGRVNIVRLLVAEFVRGYQDFIGVAHVPLVPVVAVVNNAVNVLLIHHFDQSFL